MVSNVLLIFAVKKRTTSTVRCYGNMVLSSSIMDIIYICAVVSCHHQIQVHGHVFIIMSYGLEYFLLPWWWPQNLLSGMEYFVVVWAVLILPAQFYYRYYLLTTVDHDRQKDWKLFNLVAISFVLTWPTYILTIACHKQTKGRGLEEYQKLLDPVFFDSHGNTHMTAAIDFKDWEAIVGFFYSGAMMSGAYFVALYYGYMSFKKIVPEGGVVTQKVQKLRVQFMRNLIAQTINSYIFAVFPMLIIVACVFIGTNTKHYGIGIMLVSAWCPFMNAALSIIIIRPYREFVFGRLMKKGEETTIDKKTSMSKPGGGHTIRNMRLHCLLIVLLFVVVEGEDRHEDVVIKGGDHEDINGFFQKMKSLIRQIRKVKITKVRTKENSKTHTVAPFLDYDVSEKAPAHKRQVKVHTQNQEKTNRKNKPSLLDNNTIQKPQAVSDNRQIPIPGTGYPQPPYLPSTGGFNIFGYPIIIPIPSWMPSWPFGPSYPSPPQPIPGYVTPPYPIPPTGPADNTTTTIETTTTTETTTETTTTEDTTTTEHTTTSEDITTTETTTKTTTSSNTTTTETPETTPGANTTVPGYVTPYPIPTTTTCHSPTYPPWPPGPDTTTDVPTETTTNVTTVTTPGAYIIPNSTITAEPITSTQPSASSAVTIVSLLNCIALCLLVKSS
ncbi:unnamed protein product [Bursaphelenchus okinawaensis]|uniref:Uncharacterized protein n=1 Tax=Bursaphelenchus okinawaensis TaxID=465554 RepID=A0A811KMT7_9BILA|nr:unnamed protein product [Bursaphelenchus okinawaensis]CAG9105460.1 unnamed protein product [Bursaphelenchus okinawaensis]